MRDSSDMELVRDYALRNSEAAFAELVQRHVNLVYSAALRHTGIAAQAEEITQAVFIILARKAASLRANIVVEAWLYETTRLTALSYLRAERRRQFREQEAYMQSTFQDSTNDPVWRHMAPLLDEAMSRLGRKEREAVVLRFFRDKNLRETAAGLGISEAAAQKRVNRGLERLHHYFSRRGVSSTTAIIAGEIAVNSVQVAPVGLAKVVTAAAIAKGAAASTSTLTLIKGALKIMTWSKAKTAIVAGACVLLAAGTTTVAVTEYQEHRTYAWEIAKVNKPADIEFNFPTPRVQIKRSIYSGFQCGMGPGSRTVQMPDGTFVQTNDTPWVCIGLGVTLDDMVRTAYGAQKHEVVYLTKLPEKPLYDYVSNLPYGAAEPLQELIQKKFGIAAKWEVRETDVLLLQLADHTMQAFKPAESLLQSANVTSVSKYDRFYGSSRGNMHFDQTMESLVKQLWLEEEFHVPIIDETGITNRFDFVFKYPSWYNDGRPDPEKRAWEKALYNQLGLELVPARRPVKMLVVAKAR